VQALPSPIAAEIMNISGSWEGLIAPICLTYRWRVEFSRGNQALAAAYPPCMMPMPMWQLTSLQTHWAPGGVDAELLIAEPGWWRLRSRLRSEPGETITSRPGELLLHLLSRTAASTNVQVMQARLSASRLISASADAASWTSRELGAERGNQRWN
jgi:hypothetical protein